MSSDPWASHAGRRLRAAVAAEFRLVQAPCAACGQAIDYDAPANEPNALDVGHRLPRSTHPHLTLDRRNLRAEHVRCNRSNGNRGDRLGLGEASEEW